jgi:hypothetical protein
VNEWAITPRITPTTSLGPTGVKSSKLGSKRSLRWRVGKAQFRFGSPKRALADFEDEYIALDLPHIEVGFGTKI